ncbi:TetR/AcrR family transcriptional regulator [Corynebacterium tuscaniense]|uniref:TetR/AcrR family transcriptional regulator n=2 Tax=Corynebacterium tuscaniense TaxID=302449 RepID=A0A2N6T7E4_9CORY|nr:TetR/AcrR family transcriptional regulator [Corynebacterium tuscaniense]PMC65244.1 TetR/AcrR family transcriptional regulator [Corynebacterium tuscaniense]
MNSMKVMGRPREFDEDQVIRKAIALFGERGFNAPPVDAILSSLGINRSSFYKLFGSKHGLLHAALEAVCQEANAGEVTEDAKNLVVVTLVEVAPTSHEMRGLILDASVLCFGKDNAALGEHLLNRASGKLKGETNAQ